MPDAITIMISFWSSIMLTIPNSPFIYLFALAIVLTILNNLYFWVIGGITK